MLQWIVKTVGGKWKSDSSVEANGWKQQNNKRNTEKIRKNEKNRRWEENVERRRIENKAREV